MEGNLFDRFKKDQRFDSTEINPGPFIIKKMERAGIDPEATKGERDRKDSIEKLENEEAVLQKIVDSFDSPDTDILILKDQYSFIFNEEAFPEVTKEDLYQKFSFKLAEIREKQKALHFAEN